MRLFFPVPTLCRVLGVSSSGYYASCSRGPSVRSREEKRLEVEIQAAHRRTRKTYGSERLQQDLSDNGVRVGLHRIKVIRRKLGLRCIQNRRFRVTTDSGHGLWVADNLLGQRFGASAPAQVWVTDITYVPTDEGWLYLAGHKDLYTRAIVGCAMGSRITKSLVTRSLLQAVFMKRPKTGLLHHSHRGSQYCAYDYRKLLDQFQMQASMSSKGNCYDSAPMESFWGILKNELVFHRHYKTRQEAITNITEYIEVFYNHPRKQKKLGYLSPVAFERRYYQQQKAA
jgi:putative transposase